MTILASRQIFGWYPARIRTSKREWKYSGMAVYAILRHSNPSTSGPGALLDEEDIMAFRISLCVARGHGKRRVGVVGSGSRLAVSGGGKSALRKSLAFSANVFAVTSCRVMSGVGSVLLGLVYRMAVKISLPRAPWRKLFQFFDFASRTALKKAFLTAENWFRAGMVLSAFHSRSLVFMILRF